MADPVTNNYSLVLPTVGGDINLWGGVLNNGVITALDTILSGALPVSITTTDVALTASQFQNAVFTLSGALTGNRNLTIPLSPNSATVACAGRFIVNNGTTGAFNVTVKTVAAGSTGVIVPQGLKTELYSDGTNVYYADDSKTYITPVSGSPNGQLAGTASTVNNPPFPLAIDYTTQKLWYPTTTGTSTTTIWQQLLANSAPTPVALYASLVIKVLTTTTASVSASGVSLTDGAGNYFVATPASTINLGTTGANALDQGTIAIDTWYAIWVIAKADGTTACLASASFTRAGLNLPSGYVYSGRVGAVQTIHASATLYGTWQLGRDGQYIAGLAQTAQAPVVRNGITPTFSNSSPSGTTITVQGNGFWVPPTASHIVLDVTNTWKAGSAANVLIAPNNSWFGANNGPGGSNGVVWPIYLQSGVGTNAQIELSLESSSLFMAADTAGFAASCLGWTDNI